MNRDERIKKLRDPETAITEIDVAYLLTQLELEIAKGKRLRGIIKDKDSLLMAYRMIGGKGPSMALLDRLDKSRAFLEAYDSEGE